MTRFFLYSYRNGSFCDSLSEFIYTIKTQTAFCTDFFFFLFFHPCTQQMYASEFIKRKDSNPIPIFCHFLQSVPSLTATTDWRHSRVCISSDRGHPQQEGNGLKSDKGETLLGANTRWKNTSLHLCLVHINAPSHMWTFNELIGLPISFTGPTAVQGNEG